jgi:nickel-dependent lactate racemase
MQMGTPAEIQEYLSKIPPKESISEQWCVQIFTHMLMKHRIILVTDGIDEETVRRVNMIPAKTADEALEMAYGIKGRNASVVAIPDGVAVMAV